MIVNQLTKLLLSRPRRREDESNASYLIAPFLDENLDQFVDSILSEITSHLIYNQSTYRYQENDEKTLVFFSILLVVVHQFSSVMNYQESLRRCRMTTDDKLHFQLSF